MKALHDMPPSLVALQYGGVAQPPESPVLFTGDDALQVNRFDLNMYGWEKAKLFLKHVSLQEAQELDLSDGSMWPWWLWLSGTGRRIIVLDDGVLSFHVVQLEAIKCFRIRTAKNNWFVFPGTGVEQKMMVRDQADLAQEIAKRKSPGHSTWV